MAARKMSATMVSFSRGSFMGRRMHTELRTSEALPALKFGSRFAFAPYGGMRHKLFQ
jgi:hypothetical protein